MKRILFFFKKDKVLNAVFLSDIFLSFHYYLIVYINSTFLNKYFSETQVSALYIIGSIINVFLLLNISKILKHIGNYRLALYAVAVEGLAILGMLTTSTNFLLGFYFIIQQIAIPLILFNLDLFLESASTNEAETGDIRGIYLTLSNITLVVAPAIVAMLLNSNQYWHVYGFSFLFLLPLFYFIQKYFKNYTDSQKPQDGIIKSIQEFLKDKKLYNVFITYSLLQLFYAYMTIYTPLYLEKYVGFSWSEIGIMFTIMFLPFVLLELPVGDLADRKYGEKGFLTSGLIIMGLSTLCISFITVKSFWIWTIVLFMTRVGASLVEITSDSYFFRQVNQERDNIISLYRVARPLSSIMAPIIATVALQFMPFEYTFIVIGSLMIIGTHYSISIIGK